MAKSDKTKSKSKAPEVETKGKGKSKSKPEPEVKTKGGKGKGAASSDFAKPSEAPATGGDSWQLTTEDNLGDLFLITPLREIEVDDKFSKQPGAVKQVIVCDIVHINEKKPAKSELHEDVYIFAGWIKGSLRGYIGERQVLGRLAQGKEDRGNLPWILEDADDDDIKIALEYKGTVDPFAQKGAKDKGAKGEKAGKDKGAKSKSKSK